MTTLVKGGGPSRLCPHCQPRQLMDQLLEGNDLVGVAAHVCVTCGHAETLSGLAFTLPRQPPR